MASAPVPIYAGYTGSVANNGGVTDPVLVTVPDAMYATWLNQGNHFGPYLVTHVDRFFGSGPFGGAFGQAEIQYSNDGGVSWHLVIDSDWSRLNAHGTNAWAQGFIPPNPPLTSTFLLFRILSTSGQGSAWNWVNLNLSLFDGPYPVFVGPVSTIEVSATCIVPLAFFVWTASITGARANSGTRSSVLVIT